MSPKLNIIILIWEFCLSKDSMELDSEHLSFSANALGKLGPDILQWYIRVINKPGFQQRAD